MEPLYQKKEWLNNQFIKLKKSKKEIAKECGASYNVIDKWLRMHNIFRINREIVRTMYYIYEIRDLDGNIITIRSAVPNLKKCHNCGWEYLYSNGKLRVRKYAGSILENIYHKTLHFCCKECKIAWISEMNSFGLAKIQFSFFILPNSPKSYLLLLVKQKPINIRLFW